MSGSPERPAINHLDWLTGGTAGAPGCVDRGDGTRQGVRIQRKGPGGLEILVQHDGFVAIYSHLGMAAPAFAQGKRPVAAGEKLGVVERTGVTRHARIFRDADGRKAD
jgi:hypothetical protein